MIDLGSNVKHDLKSVGTYYGREFSDIQRKYYNIKYNNEYLETI
jgi:hypothetical protein